MRIVIAEDAVLLREGLASLLGDAGIEVVARVADGPGLEQEVKAHVTKLEKTCGKKLGAADDPLLVSVRSGAARSMPGMMGGAMMSGDQMRQMMGANADVDTRFLQMMIPHHEAAIAMAQQALTQAEHPEIKTLAQGIITTQRAEIGEMQGFLTR